MISTKLRRQSGRRTPQILFCGMSKREIIENCLEPQEQWNDWLDYRDGFRSCDDRKHLRKGKNRTLNYLNSEKWNKKLKKLIERRKYRKTYKL